MYGFIGLGEMGNRMAANLLRHRGALQVFDVNATSVQKLAAMGATPCATPSEVARKSQVVITMLPSTAVVREVYQAPQTGVLAGLQRDSLLLDCSTVDVETPRAIAAAVQALNNGITFADAPVSGGIVAAEAGTLTFLVGGDEQCFTKAEPVLKLMGKAVVHCGLCGSGQAVKLSNNLALGICMGAIAEAMLLGTRLGVKPEVLAAALNNATARCWSSEVYNPYPGIIPTAPASKEYKPGFTVDLMRKDLHLAQDAAKSVGLSTPLGSKATEVYDAIREKGYGSLDFSVVLKALDEEAGKH
eukprot:GGOE01009529.1.p1 GENE.GGOE01009529.1~~GGOE01009529.1.p1  ORF type:complete len:301 (-),score=131.22 GGOE01009529.1:296-1198(-)